MTWGAAVYLPTLVVETLLHTSLGPRLHLIKVSNTYGQLVNTYFILPTIVALPSSPRRKNNCCILGNVAGRGVMYCAGGMKSISLPEVQALAYLFNQLYPHIFFFSPPPPPPLLLRHSFYHVRPAYIVACAFFSVAGRFFF